MKPARQKQFIATDTVAIASEELLDEIAAEKEISDPPAALAQAIIRRSCACGSGDNGVSCKEV